MIFPWDTDTVIWLVSCSVLLVLTCEDKVTILHCCAVRTDSEVYVPSVQVPLVSVWVIGGCRAAVIPQPHVVKTHRGPAMVERWGRHRKGWTGMLWWTNMQTMKGIALDSLRQSSCRRRVAEVAAQARTCVSVRGVGAFLTPHSCSSRVRFSAGRTLLLSALSILGINTKMGNSRKSTLDCVLFPPPCTTPSVRYA